MNVRVMFAIVVGIVLTSMMVLSPRGGEIIVVPTNAATGDQPLPQKASKATPPTIDESNSDLKRPHGVDGSLLEPFVRDPSFDARCPEKPVPTRSSCPSWPLPSKDLPVPPLQLPLSKGQTTQGMEVVNAADHMHKEVAHHPVFNAFAKRTYTPHWIEKRVVEFTGSHTDYDYDCGDDSTVGNFRLYHQVRANMCNEYEKRKEQLADNAEATQVGMYPLVDEEYYEMIMTLTTALQAAEENRPYTFLELGARYGTWIVRAGAAYRTLTHDAADPKQLKLLAVEGNCPWFMKMREHVECNGFKDDTDLILGYAAPREYNKVDLKRPATFKEPRAVSLLDMLPAYEFVDMIDFDIQGFEYMTISEKNVAEMLTERVGFIHFGTHSNDIEKNIVNFAQSNGWCVVYMFSGAHTKKLNKGHRCNTPFGPSVFNDGSLGIANMKFYPQLKSQCVKLNIPNARKAAQTCYSHTIMGGILRREDSRA